MKEWEGGWGYQYYNGGIRPSCGNGGLELDPQKDKTTKKKELY